MNHAAHNNPQTFVIFKTKAHLSSWRPRRIPANEFTCRNVPETGTRSSSQGTGSELQPFGVTVC